MRKVTLFLFSAITIGVLLGIGLQESPQVDAQAPKVKHPRGHKPAPPEVRARWHAEAFRRHGHRISRLPKATQPTFDCRTAFNNVLPTDDQMQCGDCFGVSAADGCSMALIKAGVLPLDASKGRLSSQYGLDSGAFQGGCNGGDELQVIDYIKTTGFPLTSDYGPYVGGPLSLKPISGMTLYKIGDYGYCTPSQQQGVADTQDMKNTMAQYGPLSVAFDASGTSGYNWPDVMSGDGSSVDHAVLCIGWDDSKGAFLGMNQWGSGWGGPNGTFWIKYGSYSWGTEAAWITAGSVPPPPPPPTAFKLFEGTMQAPVPVGAAAGYPDLPTAMGAGQTIANTDNQPVMVHDPSGAMVATIQPNGPVPPIPPTPPGTLTTITTSADLAAGTYTLAPPGSVVLSRDTIASLKKAIADAGLSGKNGSNDKLEKQLAEQQRAISVLLDSVQSLQQKVGTTPPPVVNKESK